MHKRKIQRFYSIRPFVMPFVWCCFCSVARQEARRLMCVCVFVCVYFDHSLLFLFFIFVFFIFKVKTPNSLSSFQCLSFCSTTNCQSNNLIKSVRLKRCKNIKTWCQWMALRSPRASPHPFYSFLLFLIRSQSQHHMTHSSQLGAKISTLRLFE